MCVQYSIGKHWMPFMRIQIYKKHPLKHFYEPSTSPRHQDTSKTPPPPDEINVCCHITKIAQKKAQGTWEGAQGRHLPPNCPSSKSDIHRTCLSMDARRECYCYEGIYYILNNVWVGFWVPINQHKWLGPRFFTTSYCCHDQFNKLQL